jgi:hypothetical protein
MLVKSNIVGLKQPTWWVTEGGILTPLAAKKKVEEEADAPEEEDEWDKVEEEEEWDPDFDEFDVPKSRTGKSNSKDDNEDVNFEEDEEFKDLFDEEGFDEESSDEDF